MHLWANIGGQSIEYTGKGMFEINYIFHFYKFFLNLFETQWMFYLPMGCIKDDFSN